MLLLFLNRVSLCRMTGYTEHISLEYTACLLMFHFIIFKRSVHTDSYFFESMFSFMYISHLSLNHTSRIQIKVLSTFVDELNIKIKAYLLWNPQVLQELSLNRFFLQRWLLVMCFSIKFKYLGICNWFNA